MGIRETKKLQHWNYFLALESDVEVLSRYIEFSKDNFSAFSLELAHLLLTASSEVDVVCKILCNQVSPDNTADNIYKYREIINPSFPNIKKITVAIPRHGLELIPWKNWQSNRTPIWWSDHNKVKHERNINFKKANLKNALNAMAGLYVLLLHFYKDEAEIAELVPNPTLFMIEDEFIDGIEALGTFMRVRYNLKVNNS